MVVRIKSVTLGLSINQINLIYMYNHNYFLGRCFLLFATFSLVFGLSNKSYSQITSFPWVEDFGSGGCSVPAGFTNTGSDPWDFQNINEFYMEGVDHTTGVSGVGCFASMDDSGSALDDTCLLTSPTLDLGGATHAQLRFWWQNSNSTSSLPAATGPRPWSNLYIDISMDDGVTWTRNVWAVEDSQQIGWTEAIVNLAPYASSTTVLRFRGLETQYFTSDLALDDIMVSVPDQFDASMDALISPVNGGCEDVAANVTFNMSNFGWDTITTITFSYQLNSDPVVSETVNLNLGPVASYTHTFTQTVSLLAGIPNTLKVWADLPGDTTVSNDTLTRPIEVIGTVATFPYIEDFESGQADWIASGTNSSWAFGTPANPVINGASSGVNAFVTGLNGTYNTNENSEVRGPCFDFSDMEGTPWVAVDVWWNSEFSWDGAVLQYSDNEGQSWNNVGVMGDPHNWYNDNTINGNPGDQQEGWSGRQSTGNGSGGWVLAKHALPQSLAGNAKVLLRVAFGSDGSVVDDGFAFDNFRIIDYKKAELGPERISLCGQSQIILDPHVSNPGWYTWSTGDTVNATIPVTTSGTYTVQYTDSLLNLTSLDTVEVIVSAPPVIDFTKAVDTAAVTSSVTLDPNLGLDLNYMWTPGNYTYPYLLVRGSDWGVGSHTFTLQVEDSVLCTDQATAIAVFVDITGIEGVEDGQLLLYPNPVKDMVNVQLKNIKADRISVYSMLGQLIDSRQMTGQSRVQIDMSDYQPGMYMMVLNVGDEQIVHQLIKE